jgi:polar amino acid transport system substrate-binding protein
VYRLLLSLSLLLALLFGGESVQADDTAQSDQNRSKPPLPLLDLSPKERAFLQKHPTIVLGTDKLWHPYVVVRPTGEITGYDTEVLRLINKITGAHFVLKVGVWATMQEEAKARKIDGLSTGAAIPSRKSYLNFSKPYIAVHKMVITSSNNPKNIRSLDDLRGKRIALHRGNISDKRSAEKIPEAEIFYFDTAKEVLEAVASGKADIMFANGSTLFLANELGMPYFKRVALLPEKLELVFAVRNDWPEAIGILNKALDAIGEKRLKALQRKWFWQEMAMPLHPQRLKLNEEQKNYLHKRGQVRYCLDPDWMPLEAIAKGEATGMGADFIKHFSERTGTPFVLIPSRTWGESLKLLEEGACDIAPLIMPSRSRSSRFNFTTPYLSVPIVLATTFEKPYIANLHNLEEKKVGVVKNYVFKELLEDRYPNLRFVEVESVRDGLERVREGELFGLIDNLYAIGYQIQKRFLSELKLAAKLEETLYLSVGVSKHEPKLLPIMQQTIDSLEPSLIDKVISQWLSVTYEKEPDYSLLWKILAGLSIVMLLLFYRHYFLERYNRRLKRDVARQVEELRKKDVLIVSKLRMAAMGEMLSMIAHQWRQPLSAIANTLLNIDMQIKSGRFDMQSEEGRRALFAFLEERHGKIDDYVAYLSHTVDDFRNFFRPDKAKERVPITQPVEQALSILGQSLQSDGIVIEKHYRSEEEIPLYHNEVMQVILNLLKNSQQSFEEQGIEAPRITIETRAQEDRLVISLCDNAGGIPDTILPHIFEPYFTTKNEANGAGLGLYMSQSIIEEHHKGKLTVFNRDGGACFELHFFTTQQTEA